MIVDTFAIRNFYIHRDGGCANLFHRVCPVCIEIRKAQQPPIVHLELVGRPSIQGKIFYGFYIRLHGKTSGCKLISGIE